MIQRGPTNDSNIAMFANREYQVVDEFIEG